MADLNKPTWTEGIRAVSPNTIYRQAAKKKREEAAEKTEHKKKTVLMFQTDCVLKEEVRQKIHEDLKRQIDSGVVVLDVRFDYVKTLLPEDCEINVDIVSMEGE